MTRIAFNAAAPLAATVSGWWNDINESRLWQGRIFFFLCAAYAIVAAGALVQLIRIQLRVLEYGWTRQKAIHLLSFLVNGVRAVIFGFHKQVFILNPRVLTLVVLDLPDMLFFSTYTQLVLFWAEVYYQARGLASSRVGRVYAYVNGGIYSIQAMIWTYLWADESAKGEMIADLFIAVVSFVAALGFIIYGGGLFLMLKHYPIESKGRQNKLCEVGSVTFICVACFLVRCIMTAVSAFDTGASLEVADHPVLNLIYYMLVEILPTALVLYILRQLPKRVPSHYHPLR